MPSKLAENVCAQTDSECRVVPKRTLDWFWSLATVFPSNGKTGHCLRGTDATPQINQPPVAYFRALLPQIGELPGRARVG